MQPELVESDLRPSTSSGHTDEAQGESASSGHMTRSGRKDLKALQSPRDHEIPQTGFGLLQSETQATPWASEPGLRDRCADPDIGRCQELVNVVLRP